MSFFEIGFKNIRRKFGTYLIYFVSTVFSVSIFNLFCSMYYNPSFEAYRFGAGKIGLLFKGTAIAVLLFASIFVLFSSSYFIKTRKKEIAMYSLLGMRKTQIAEMMFVETFVIGMLAVLCGTAIGTCGSGGFTALLMKFMGEGTKVTFIVEAKAVAVTVIAFTILFVVSGLMAYRTIYRYKLVQLLAASKKGEAIPKFSTAGGIIGAVLVVIGYSIALKLDVDKGGMELLLPGFGILVVVCVGTYFLFCNLIPMLLIRLKRGKKFYYKTTNFISISQLIYRIKANSKMLSVVAVLCATTITMLSATYSIYRGLEDTTQFYAPFSYLCKDINEKQHEAILKAIEEVGEVKVTAEDKVELIRVKIQNEHYVTEKAKKSGAQLGDEVGAYLLSESAYKKIINDTQAKVGESNNIKTDFKGELRDAECYFIDGNVTVTYCKDLAGDAMKVLMDGEEKDYTVKGISLHKYIGMADLYGNPTLIISDKVYESYRTKVPHEKIVMFDGFMFDDEMASESTVNALNKIVATRLGYGGMPDNVSYIGFYKAAFALYGSYVFIGLFIGILFMLAVGSIMYYKLIIEAQEEVSRYDILRKIGMNKKEVIYAIMKQLGMVYGLPLGIGLIHTLFALLTYNRTMDLLGQETPTLWHAAIIVFIFIIVYGAFYMLSAWNYFKIIWGRK